MKRPWLMSLLLALRPKQWTKNLLVPASLVFALGDRHQHLGLSVGWATLQAVLLFCAVSSGIYLLNDLRDVRLDREHPIKRKRPIAAGELSIGAALVAALILLAGGLSGGFALRPALGWVLSGYVVMQIAYTFGLKRVALVDIFVIAAGFVLRALAGAVAIDVPISPWLLLCTLLLALFLALCKRRHEKVVLQDLGASTRESMAGYHAKLLDQLIAVVSAATIVTYSIYTLWPETVEKFGTSMLGFTIPFVLFGLFRYLDLVYRHEKGDRPEQILLTDLPLLIDLALYAVTAGAVLLWSHAGRVITP